MAVNLNLIPTKGMTLPFISYGGSSLLALAIGMGMLLALTRAAPRRCREAAAVATGPILIAAGGTGGHMFPALALAGALVARGGPVALVTDRAGRQWHGALSAADSLRSRAGSPSGVLRRAAARRCCALARGLFDACWRCAASSRPPRSLRRLRLGAGGAGRAPAPGAATGPRAERRVRPGQPADGRLRATRGLSFEPTARVARRPMRRLLTGNPVRARVRDAARRRYRRAGPGRFSVCWCSAAARARGSSATWCRRPWPCCPRSCARGSIWPSSAGRRISSASRAAYAGARHRSRARQLLRRRARRGWPAPHLVITRSGASTVAELLALGRPSLLVPYPYTPPTTTRPPTPAPGRGRRGAAGDPAAGLHRRAAGGRAGGADARRPQRLAGDGARRARAGPARRRDAARRSGRRLILALTAGDRADDDGAARRRPDPFRRHRRHRHERHRRDPAQSRLHGAGLGHRRQRQRAAPARATASPVAIGHAAEEPGQGAGGRGLDRDPAGQPRAGGGARAAPAGGAARRHAGRADAPEALDRGRRHPRQDHDHRDDGGPARRRRARPDRGQRRHHQRLRHQRPAGPGRVDRGRGRRERRQLPAPAGHRRRGDQHRPRAHGALRQLRRGARRLPRLRRARAVLRLRRAVHRPSRGPGALSAASPTGASSPTASARRPTCGPCHRRPRPTASVFDVVDPRQERRGRAAAGAGAACRCRACTTSRTRWPRSPSRASWASPTTWSVRTLSGLRRRQAPLHPHRHGRRRRRSIDDYGHHPVEIAAVLQTARARADGPRDRRGAAAPLHAASPACSTSSAPASTTPTRSWSPVYAAGEPPIEGVSRDALVEGVLRRAATATCGRSTARTIWRRWSPRRRGRATSWSASAPAASPRGPRAARPASAAATEKSGLRAIANYFGTAA